MRPRYTTALTALYAGMTNPPLAPDDWRRWLLRALEPLPAARGALYERDAASGETRPLADSAPGGSDDSRGLLAVADRAMRVRAPVTAAGDGFDHSLGEGPLEIAVGTRLAWPLRAGAVLVGALALEFAAAGPLDAEARAYLGLVAAQGGWALEIGRLRQQDQRRSLLLDIKTDVSRKVASILNFDQLLAETALLMQALLRHHQASIFLLDADRGDLTLAASAGPGSAGKPRAYRQALNQGLIGRCVRTGAPVHVPDVRGDPDYVVGRNAEACAELDVPILFEGRTLGVLALIATAPGAFSADDLLVAQAVADQVAPSIRNAQLHRATERQLQQLSAVYDINLDIISRLDMGDLLREIVERAVPLLQGDGGGVYLADADGGALRLAVGYGAFAAFTGDVLPAGAGLCGLVFDTQEPRTVTDYARWEGRLRPPAVSPISQGALAVPLTYAGQRLGVLTVSSSDTARPFTPDDVRLATLFASQATVAIANAQLHVAAREQATRDGLSGLHNRRYFVDHLRRLSSETAPATVVMLDLDGLKQVNDTRGHAAGDTVLQRLAGVLRASAPPGAVLARLGGDEFALLAGPAAPGEVAAQLRALNAQTAAANRSQAGPPLAFSIGVAARRGAEPLEDTLRRADRRMYMMKQIKRIRRGARKSRRRMEEA
jgi:diguanylate cyclase (GGDEF)-like protein